jgi:hypothetical protein
MTTVETIEEAANRLRAANPTLSREGAAAKALAERPELYNRFLREIGEGAGGETDPVLRRFDEATLAGSVVAIRRLRPELTEVQATAEAYRRHPADLAGAGRGAIASERVGSPAG